MDEIQSPADLKRYVEEHGGVASLPMWRVRNAHGHDRLGRHVRDKIARELAGIGLSTFPEGSDIPEYQDDEIRIFKQGSAAADLIQAVLTVGRERDKTIRQYLSDESKEMIKEIQTILERRNS